MTSSTPFLYSRRPHRPAGQDSGTDAVAALRKFLRAVTGRRLEINDSSVVEASPDEVVAALENAIQVLVAKALKTPDARNALAAMPMNPAPGYDAALSAGAEARTRLFKSNALLSSDDMATQLGVTRETINTRRKDGALLGLTNGTRQIRYPAWQAEVNVRPQMPELLRVLKDVDSWAIYLFMTQGSDMLDGRSPLEGLRGRDGRVLEATHAFAAEMA